MNNHDHDKNGTKEAEQIQIARQIGADVTDVFVGFVRGRVPFDEMAFGVFDAMHDLAAVASGDYELETDEDHEHQHYHDHEAAEEQEDLAQEPSRNADA
ncbi:MAG TPA: hypothetical protein VGR22_11060 [Thermomicrobiales bacterium]|nr:hypothetical protein [Thermomicrobiales bacterium]